MLIFKDNCLILSNWKRSDMHSAQCTAKLASILSSDWQNEADSTDTRLQLIAELSKSAWITTDIC